MAKIFVIGRNKTGTTSMKVLLGRLGYRVGIQSAAELLIEDWARGDFAPILEYCRSADAFQDVPFSLPRTYAALDAGFPDSKFILTVRSSPREWFESLTRFHTRIVGKGRLPTVEDLKGFSYRYEGYFWRMHQLVYGADENTLYDPELYMSHYTMHNQKAREYFAGRDEKFLEINLSSPDALARLNRFLGPDVRITEIPHKNRSRANR